MNSHSLTFFTYIPIVITQVLSTLDSEFKAVNDLLNKYMTDDKHYKLYTELTKEDTKALAEAVTKLGEPLSQMGIVIDATPKK